MIDGVDPLAGAEDADRDALEYGAWALDAIANGLPGLTWTEERFVATGIVGCGGYTDLLSVDDLLGEAVLIELKTGRGDRARATDNRQVQAYALGVLHDLPSVDRVVVYLIECDRETTTRAVFTRPDMAGLRGVIKTIIINAELATDASLRAGKQCGYCARREQCPPLVASPELALALIGPRTMTPADYAGAMSPETLAETLAKVAPLAELVEAYVGALKARAMTLLEAGAEVPGWTIKRSGGARRWADEAGAAAALADAGYDMAESMDLASPSQVEKRLGKEAKAIIAPYLQQAVNKSLKQV
jgi:hypothetical protein